MNSDIYLGVQIEPQFGYNFDQIKTILQGAEQYGFSHAWFSDHFMMREDSTDLISYECFSAMMAAAASTETLRIGSLVFCNNYRHPAVLAKQIASLDHYSNGRVEFGYGAGWKEIEYNAYGMDFPSAGTRIKMMNEGIEVIRKLWTEEYANYTGEYYQLNAAVSYPKPLQQPHPPIWMGTMKAGPKMLKAAVNHADGINIAWSFSPDVYQEKLERISSYCEENGRDPDTLALSYGVWTRIFEKKEQKLKAMEEMKEARGFTDEQLQERLAGSLYGTPDEILVKLRKYIELGITHFIFMFPKDQEVQSMNLFYDKIIPEL